MANRYGTSVWLATGLSYLDRAAAFICPLLTLKWLGRSDVYVSIEFVISLSIIFATFFDAGLRSYMLYDAKERGAEAAILSTGQALKPLVWLHIVGVLLFMVLGWNSGSAQLVGLAIARGSALSVIGLIIHWLILVERPALGPLVSIVNWGLSCLSLAWPIAGSEIIVTTVFFSGSFMIMLAAAFFTIFPMRSSVNARPVVEHLVSSLRWGWPLLISAAASMMVGNFSKLYAFTNLSAVEVLAFTFWMRAYSIVQLSHAAIISILVGQIYHAAGGEIIRNNFSRYLKFIAPPTVLIASFGLFGHGWISSIPFLDTPTAAVLVAYFGIWCLGAYFEIYVTKTGHTMSILKAALASSIIYVLGILFTKPESALHLATLMAVSATLYTALLILKLRKVR